MGGVLLVLGLARWARPESGFRHLCFTSIFSLSLVGRDGQRLWRVGNRGYLSITIYSHTRITVYPLSNYLNGYTHTHNRL